MIAFVRGPVLAIENDMITVDTGCLGYQVLVPMQQMDPKPTVGKDLFLHTHLQIREDAWTLFGFSDKEQLFAFRLLLSVSGIGAKTALAIINAMSVGQMAKSVLHADYESFAKTPGVGKKTAQRIVLELKDKFKDIALETDIVLENMANNPSDLGITEEDIVVVALKQLGYNNQEAKVLAWKARKQLSDHADDNQLIKEALRLAASQI